MMSSKRMPGLGKSGNWRSEFLSASVRLESSAAAAGPAAGSPPWAACWVVLEPVRVGSGLEEGGCEAVEALCGGAGCCAVLVVEGVGVEVWSGWTPDMLEEKEEEGEKEEHKSEDKRGASRAGAAAGRLQQLRMVGRMQGVRNSDAASP